MPAPRRLSCAVRYPRYRVVRDEHIAKACNARSAILVNKYVRLRHEMYVNCRGSAYEMDDLLS